MDPVCDQCGGTMRKGAVYVEMEQTVARLTSPTTDAFFMGSLPANVSVRNERAFWEEKTGEKKGFILKRDKIKRMAIQGFRCTNCGLIKLYAGEK